LTLAYNVGSKKKFEYFEKVENPRAATPPPPPPPPPHRRRAG